MTTGEATTPEARQSAGVLRRLEDTLASVEKGIVTLAMIAVFVAGVAQVAIRLTGMRSLGTDEVVTVTMAVLVFVGSGLIVYTADHIAIEILGYVPDARLRRALRVIALVALGVFGVVFGYYAWDFTQSIGGERTLQLGIPLLVSAGSMVIGAALILIHAVGALVRLLAGEEPDVEGMTTPEDEGAF